MPNEAANVGDLPPNTQQFPAAEVTSMLETIFNVLIPLLILGAIGFFVYKRVMEKRAAKPAESAQAPAPVFQPVGNARPNVPDSSTITNNQTAADYRSRLAPSTQAFMGPGPYFDSQGNALDNRGNLVARFDDLSTVPVRDPANANQVAAREALAQAIRSGNPYQIQTVAAAGFDPVGAEFAAWFRRVKAG